MSNNTASVPTPTVTSESDCPAHWFVGTLTRVKVSGDQTDGEYSIVDHLAPSGWESPFHVHHGEDELFHVMDGEIEVCYGTDGTGRLNAGPQDTVMLPRDVPHGFRVVSDEPCRILVHVTPAGFEEFIAAAGQPAERLVIPDPAEPDVEALTATAAAYDIDILGPLPQ
jgi:quercetin dioxygenase-like cupin family protein